MSSCPTASWPAEGDSVDKPVNGVNVVKFTWTAPNGNTYLGASPKVPPFPEPTTSSLRIPGGTTMVLRINPDRATPDHGAVQFLSILCQRIRKIARSCPPRVPTGHGRQLPVFLDHPRG